MTHNESHRDRSGWEVVTDDDGTIRATVVVTPYAQRAMTARQRDGLMRALDLLAEIWSHEL